MKAGKAIAFVGAGASAPMYPLWRKFIELLADHAVAEGKAEDKDAKRWKADTTSTPQQQINVILRKLGEPLYRNFLKTTFGPRKGPDGRCYTATHAALLWLPFRAYVTTNYDPVLDFALRVSTATPSGSCGSETFRTQVECRQEARRRRIGRAPGASARARARRVWRCSRRDPTTEAMGAPSTAICASCSPPSASATTGASPCSQSRFVFADLDRFLGTAFHQLDLHGLARGYGARLLEELGVHGPAVERKHGGRRIAVGAGRGG